MPELVRPRLIRPRSLGTIENADFAAADLSIWLGEKPISDPFRDQLLSP